MRKEKITIGKIVTALDQTDGDITATAKKLKVSRRGLQYAMDRLGVSLEKKIVIKHVDTIAQSCNNPKKLNQVRG